VRLAGGGVDRESFGKELIQEAGGRTQERVVDKAVLAGGTHV